MTARGEWDAVLVLTGFALWISQPFVLGRIYPWLTPLWIRGLGRGGENKRGAEGRGVAPLMVGCAQKETAFKRT